jgi:hypothetical protein
MAVHRIRKARGHVLAGVAAVRDELLEEEPAGPQVEHPEARLDRRPRVVDHRQRRRRRKVAGRDTALDGAECQLEHFRRNTAEVGSLKASGYHRR